MNVASRLREIILPLYSALVRSHCESWVCSPQCNKDLDLMEWVHWRSTKIHEEKNKTFLIQWECERWDCLAWSIKAWGESYQHVEWWERMTKTGPDSPLWHSVMWYLICSRCKLKTLKIREWKSLSWRIAIICFFIYYTNKSIFCYYNKYRVIALCVYCRKGESWDMNSPIYSL